MKKTYAYNSVIIGVVLGILVWATTENMVLGILACFAVSVVGFIAIRFLENLVSKGAEKAYDTAKKAYKKHQNNQNEGDK